MPPRATSITAKSTRGFCSTIRAERGPDASAFTTSRSSMTMPSVEVMPTWRPTPFMMCAIIREVVVLPLVPVTATIGTREGAPGGKSRSTTGLAMYCGSPTVGWVCIRKPGRGVDLADRAAGLAHRRGDVGADEVDAGHVEPDQPGGLLGDLDVVGVCVEGAVDRDAAGRHVAGQGQLDHRVGGRHVVEGVKPCSREQLQRGGVDLDLGEHLLVPDPAARVGVGDLDELADGVRAVAGHVRGHPLGDGLHPAADDEAAVVAAGHHRLDDDVAAAGLVLGHHERLGHLGVGLRG